MTKTGPFQQAWQLNPNVPNIKHARQIKYSILKAYSASKTEPENLEPKRRFRAKPRAAILGAAGNSLGWRGCVPWQRSAGAMLRLSGRPGPRRDRSPSTRASLEPTPPENPETHLIEKGAVVEKTTISKKSTPHPPQPGRLKRSKECPPQPRKEPNLKKARKIRGSAMPHPGGLPGPCGARIQKEGARLPPALLLLSRQAQAAVPPSPNFGLRERTGPSESKRDNGIRGARAGVQDGGFGSSGSTPATVSASSLKWRPQLPVLTFTNTHTHTQTHQASQSPQHGLSREAAPNSSPEQRKHREI